MNFPHSLFIQRLFLFMIVFFSTASSHHSIIHAKEFEGQKITFLVNSSHIVAAEKLAEWFNEETGAVVEIKRASYQDLYERTLNHFQSDSDHIDVLMAWYVTVGNLAEKGVLADLTDFLSKNKKTIQPDDFIPSIYDAYTLYRQRRWGIPFDGDIHILFYRKSLLERHNLTPPTTWNDFLKVTRTINEKENRNGIYGAAIMASPSPIIIVSSFMNRLGAYGGALLTEANHPTINSPEAVTALSAMVDQCRAALPVPLDTDFSVSHDAFLAGMVAMVEQWTDIGIMAEDPTRSMIKGDWASVQLPMGDGPSARHAPALNAGFILGISTKAPNRNLAEKFILFASLPETTLRLNLIPGGGGVDPVRNSVLKSEKFRHFAPEVSRMEKAAAANVIAWPNIPEAPQLMMVLAQHLADAIEGLTSPKQALDQAQNQWIEILDDGNTP